VTLQDAEQVSKPVGPFEDHDACVRHFEDDPDVDDPNALCGWMEENSDLASDFDPDGNRSIVEFVQELKDPSADNVLTDLEVTYVSGVENPAQDSQWVFAKDADSQDADWGVTSPLLLHRETQTIKQGGERTPVWAEEGESEEKDHEQKAWAPVLIPNETDKQGDVIPVQEIERAAHNFLAHYRKIDTDHDLFEGKGTPIESWTLKETQTFTLPDGTESREYPAGTWMLGVQFNDESWERILNGELQGFSIYGEASPLDIDDLLSGEVAQDNAASAQASVSTAQATAKDADGTEQTMTEELNDNDDTEKQFPTEAVGMLAGSIESFIASEDADIGASLEDYLQWGLDSGEFGVDSLTVAGEEMTAEGDGGSKDGNEEQQMSDNETEGAETPTDGEQSGEGEPSLKEMVSSVKSTVEDTQDSIKSVRERVEDLESEVYDKQEGAEGGEEPTETADLTEEDMEQAAEKAVAKQFGLGEEDLPDDPDERAEVIRKHVHENGDEQGSRVDPDSWNDEDFEGLV